MKFYILRLFSLIVLVVISAQVLAQDLLTEQAPMDKPMVHIDSVVLCRFVKAEVYEFPADDLYPPSSWLFKSSVS